MYTSIPSTWTLNIETGKLFANAIELPKLVCTSLADAVKYLSTFGLAEVLTRVDFFLRFTEKTHMLLNANTLANLYVMLLVQSCSSLLILFAEKSIGIKQITLKRVH